MKYTEEKESSSEIDFHDESIRRAKMTTTHAFPKLIDEVDALVGEELVRTDIAKQDEVTLATTPLDADDCECTESLSSTEDEEKDEEEVAGVQEEEDDEMIGYFSSATTPLPDASAIPKRSILKKTESSTVFPSLPSKPKLSLRMRRCVSEPSKVDGKQLNTKRRKSSSTLTRNVAFASVEFRHYDCTLGDNPSCSYGPPIQLDWLYVRMPSIDLEAYEADRMGKRRNLRQMLLNYYTRVNILTWGFGHTEAELKTATKVVNRVKLRRSVTRVLLPMQKVEEAVQSAKRKVKRAASGVPKRRPALPAEMRRSSRSLAMAEDVKEVESLELEEDRTVIT